MGKILIAWFSATGTTSRVAHELAKATGGQLFEIRARNPYTVEDLNWHNPESRSSLEMKDPSSRPALAGDVPDLTPFQAIFLGFPIWWYQAPRIIGTFLGMGDFAGRSIIPFATSGGSGLGETESILKKLAPAANWLPGKRLDARVSADDLQNWIKNMNI